MNSKMKNTDVPVRKEFKRELLNRYFLHQIKGSTPVDDKKVLRRFRRYAIGKAD